MRYNVMSIPTLLVFDKGEVAKRLVGAKGKGALLQELAGIPAHFPLTPGQHGEAVRDLQRRLGAAGYPSRHAPRRGSSVPRPTPRCARSSSARGCTPPAAATRTPGRRWSRHLALGDRLLVAHVAEHARRRRRRAAGAARPARVRLRAGRRHLRAAHRPRAGRLPAQLRSRRRRHVRSGHRPHAAPRQHARPAPGPGVATVREQERLRGRRRDARLAHASSVGQFGGLGRDRRARHRDSCACAGAHVLSLDEPDAARPGRRRQPLRRRRVHRPREPGPRTRRWSLLPRPAFESVGGGRSPRGSPARSADRPCPTVAVRAGCACRSCARRGCPRCCARSRRCAACSTRRRPIAAAVGHGAAVSWTTAAVPHRVTSRVYPQVCPLSVRNPDHADVAGETCTRP